MTEKKLISALQYVDESLLEEAMEAPASARKENRFRFSSLIAACLCLLCGLSAVWLFTRISSDVPEEEEYTVASIETECPTEAGGEQATELGATAEYRVALMVEAAMTDTSIRLNQGCAQWCESNGVELRSYYLPYVDVRTGTDFIEQAIIEGNNILVLPHNGYVPATIETAEMYPDVTYILLDTNELDFPEGTEIPFNVCCVSYREELAGFMAGVAAVKMGYTKLGFAGRAEDSRDRYYGSGFVQGADYAAGLLGIAVEMKYCYSKDYPTYDVVLERMTTWYAEGTEVIFACGYDLYDAAMERAIKATGKVLGEEDIVGSARHGRVLTYITKNSDKLVETVLSDLYAGGGENYYGQFHRWGLDRGIDYLGLTDAIEFGEGFTREDYEALLTDLRNGTVTVSDDIENPPETTHVTVDYQKDIFAEAFYYNTEYFTEASENNLINIEIPVFEGENEKEINALVSRFVSDKVNAMCDGACNILPSDRAITADFEGNYNAYCIDLDYQIAYNTPQQISIVFEGTSNCKTAAHPLHIMFTLNIDPVHGERCLFSDSYPIDSTTYGVFAQYAEEEIREQADPEWLQTWEGFAETICDQEAFFAGMTTETDFCHYRTDDYVVIVYPVSHALGDYMTVYIPPSAFGV